MWWGPQYQPTSLPTAWTAQGQPDTSPSAARTSRRPDYTHCLRFTRSQGTTANQSRFSAAPGSSERRAHRPAKGRQHHEEVWMARRIGTRSQRRGQPVAGGLLADQMATPCWSSRDAGRQQGWLDWKTARGMVPTPKHLTRPKTPSRPPATRHLRLPNPSWTQDELRAWLTARYSPRLDHRTRPPGTEAPDLDGLRRT